MKIIKIKALEALYSPKGIRLAAPGQIVEILEEVGRPLIEAGKAEEHKPERIPVDLKKMLAKTAEQADEPKKRSRTNSSK